MFNKRQEKFDVYSTVDLITIHKEVLQSEVDLSVGLANKSLGESSKLLMYRLGAIRKNLIGEILTRILELED